MMVRPGGLVGRGCDIWPLGVRGAVDMVFIEANGVALQCLRGAWHVEDACSSSKKASMA